MACSISKLPALTLALLAAALAAPPADAATRGPLTGLDRDSDGAVTRAEFDAARRADFRLLDRNGDGKLSRYEFYDRRRQEDLDYLELRKERYRMLDRDGDGIVTLDEYRAVGATLFARTDRDGDGKLSGEEIAAAQGPQVASRDTATPPAPEAKDEVPRKAAHPETASAAPSAHPREIGPREISPREISMRDTDEKALGDLPFDAVDANNDGFVTLAENDRALLVLFRRLDRNGNKVLSRREYYWRGTPSDKARLAARKRAYRGADEDDDGGLTFAEVRKMVRGLFERIDRNGDKRLSRAEWIAAFGPQEPAATTAADRRPAPASKTPEDTAPEDTAPEDRASAARPTPARAETETAEPKPTAESKPAAAQDIRETLDAETTPTDAPKAAERKTEVAARPPASDPAPDPTSEAPDAARRGRVAQVFAALDRDRDGHISTLELAFARMARFTVLDANGNRVLERHEFVGDRGAAAAARFAEIDRDGDGLVRWEEYKLAGAARFLQLDADGDKKLSLEEFSSAGKAPKGKSKRDRGKVAKADKPDRETPFEYEVPSR